MYDHGYRVVSTPWITTLQDQISDKLQHLKANTLRSIELYAPTTKSLYFYTDTDCHRMLRDYYGDENGAFLQIHYNQASGMTKGDICRGLALYYHGGFYMDVDLECRIPAWPHIHPNTTFVTVWEFGSNDFFQAFIGATPHHAIVKRYLDLFLEYYRGGNNVTAFDFHRVQDKKGVVLLRIAYDQIVHEQPEVMSTIQLWNETLYDPTTYSREESSPRHAHSQMGGILCQFMVTDERRDVIFWSPVPGSSKFCTAIPGST